MAIFTVTFIQGDDMNIEVAGIDDSSTFAIRLGGDGYVTGTKIGFHPGPDGPVPKPYGTVTILAGPVKTVQIRS